MEVKKITKTVEEVVGYVAFDGTEFKDQMECEKYEGTASSVIKKNFADKCVQFIVNENVAADFGSGYFNASNCDDYYGAVVRIDDEDQLRVAQMFQELVRPNAPRRFTENDIGKTLFVSIGEREMVFNKNTNNWDAKRFTYDNCWIYGTYEEMVEEFKTSINKLFNEENKEEDK